MKVAGHNTKAEIRSSIPTSTFPETQRVFHEAITISSHWLDGGHEIEDGCMDPNEDPRLRLPVEWMAKTVAPSDLEKDRKD